MNLLVENGSISEMKCGNNFAYILNDNSLFLSTEYKVLQSQEEGCFVRCMKVALDGKIEFYYMTNGYKALANMIPTLNAESFMTIITSVFSNVLTVKQNGFLSCQNIDISFEKIFVDQNTYKVVLVYLPISEKFHSDEATFENELRTNLVKVISGVSNLSSTKTLQFMSDLSDGMLSIEDLYERIKEGKTFQGMPEEYAGEKSSERINKRELRIVAMNAPVRAEVEVTKTPFIIGKKAAVVDGVFSFNKMISRVHCSITQKDRQYMITDLQSANGTYVNGVKLIPNQPHQIQSGDIIRLANSDFQVVGS